LPHIAIVENVTTGNYSNKFVNQTLPAN